MIKYILTFALLASFSAKATEVKMKSKIKEVTIFLHGAEVKRTGAQLVEGGVTEIILENLSPYIDASSVQVQASKGLTILSVSHQINNVKVREKPPRIAELEESIDGLKRKLAFKSNLDGVYENEKAMILANKSVNNQSGFDIEDLDDLSNYYRDRLSDIMLKQLELKQDQKDLNKDIKKYQKEIVDLNNKWNKRTSEVIVKVSSNVRAQAKLKVSYLIQNAGWIPSYDIRANDINSPIAVDYKAKVFQNTGVDWSNVNLTLSTGDPTKNGIKPELYTWYVNYAYNPGRRNYKKSKQKTAAYSYNESAETESMADDAGFFGEKTSADFTTSSEGMINSEFAISIPYSVPSDGKHHTVNIDNFDLPTDYTYFTAPRMDQSAYLIARVTGWDNHNLLSGSANIFFEGTFIGKSAINTRSTNDTLDISLGNDKGVQVTRTKIKETCETKFIGSDKKETWAYQIDIRNKKNNAIKVEVVDQIPVSKQKDIEVELEDQGGAIFDKQKGHLTWKWTIEPSITKTMKYIYLMEFPKDKKITR